MTVCFTHKVLFKSKVPDSEWMLYSREESEQTAKQTAQTILDWGFDSCVASDRTTLVSEVDYLLGALNVVKQEITTSRNSTDVYERLCTLTDLLVGAIQKERTGEVNYIPLPVEEVHGNEI